MYRHIPSAPQSSVPSERRGAIVGRFCHGCRSIYPPLTRWHSGKPVYGRDHVAAPCANEGRVFEPEADWWEPAVELLPAAPAPAA